MNPQTLNLGFIGAGNMAYALAFGMISKGVILPAKTWASAPTTNNLIKFKDLGCNITHNNEDILRNCSIVLLCVKPHKASEVLSKLRSKLNVWSDNPLIISILAGVQIKHLEFFLPPNTRVIRTMPNLPVLVQTGVFVYSLGNCAEPTDGSKVKYLFEKLGVCEEIAEDLIDAVNGLSGSGPAYVFTVIQAMSDGGVKMGLPRKLATKLAAQTVLGSAKLVLKTEKHPEVLRDEVCSPGGTTICGVHAIEKAGVRSAFIDAVEAGTLRAKELSSSK